MTARTRPASPRVDTPDPVWEQTSAEVVPAVTPPARSVARRPRVQEELPPMDLPAMGIARSSATDWTPLYGTCPEEISAKVRQLRRAAAVNDQLLVVSEPRMDTAQPGRMLVDARLVPRDNPRAPVPTRGKPAPAVKPTPVVQRPMYKRKTMSERSKPTRIVAGTAAGTFAAGFVAALVAAAVWVTAHPAATFVVAVIVAAMLWRPTRKVTVTVSLLPLYAVAMFTGGAGCPCLLGGACSGTHK